MYLQAGGVGGTRDPSQFSGDQIEIGDELFGGRVPVRNVGKLVL
jgi:hypothetical protein